MACPLPTSPGDCGIIGIEAPVVSVFSRAAPDDTIKIHHSCIKRQITFTFDALSAINIFSFSSVVLL
jgi:hypothetical protein